LIYIDTKILRNGDLLFFESTDLASFFSLEEKNCFSGKKFQLFYPKSNLKQVLGAKLAGIFSDLRHGCLQLRTSQQIDW